MWRRALCMLACCTAWSMRDAATMSTYDPDQCVAVGTLIRQIYLAPCKASHESKHVGSGVLGVLDVRHTCAPLQARAARHVAVASGTLDFTQYLLYNGIVDIRQWRRRCMGRSACLQ